METRYEFDEFVEGTARPLVFCRWWLRVRKVKNPEPVGPQGQPAVHEFYVPLWAWPFEFVHRVIFGKPQLLIERKLK